MTSWTGYGVLVRSSRAWLDSTSVPVPLPGTLNSLDSTCSTSKLYIKAQSYHLFLDLLCILELFSLPILLKARDMSLQNSAVIWVSACNALPVRMRRFVLREGISNFRGKSSSWHTHGRWTQIVWKVFIWKRKHPSTLRWGLGRLEIRKWKHQAIGSLWGVLKALRWHNFT